MAAVVQTDNELTKWSRVIPEKLTGPELAKNVLYFMESWCSLPHSFSKSDQFSLCLPILLFGGTFNIVLPSTSRFSK